MGDLYQRRCSYTIDGDRRLGCILSVERGRGRERERERERAVEGARRQGCGSSGCRRLLPSSTVKASLGRHNVAPGTAPRTRTSPEPVSPKRLHSCIFPKAVNYKVPTRRLVGRGTWKHKTSVGARPPSPHDTTRQHADGTVLGPTTSPLLRQLHNKAALRKVGARDAAARALMLLLLPTMSTPLPSVPLRRHTTADSTPRHAHDLHSSHQQPCLISVPESFDV
jgi:hypothetical protein